MRTQHDTALETKLQVLADRVDRLERASVDRLGDALGACSRVRRRCLDPLTDERLQLSRGAVERVALRHVPTVTGSGRLPDDRRLP